MWNYDYSTTADSYAIESLPIEVHDFPRYSWRGVLIDSSRNYLHVNTILRVLDAMSYNKYNVLHWHVVDDQSWPIVSSAFPNCTLNGAYAPTAVYTHADVQKIVSHASARGIRVVLEFDMPAHANIWAACQADLVISCSGGQTLVDPTGPAYDALTALLKEFTAFFPDAFVHLGGDEVSNLNCWEQSSKVQAFMAAHGIADVNALRNYFELQVQSIAHSFGKQAIFWEEVFRGGYTLNETTVVNTWDTGDEVTKVVESGHRVLFNYGWYLDQQTPPGGTHYLWVDTWQNFYDNDPLDGTDLTPEQQKLIIGGEASQWGEQVNSLSIDTRMWPRGCAAAERLWSDKSVRDLTTAEGRIAHMACRLNQRGVHASPVRPAQDYGYCHLPYDPY